MPGAAECIAKLAKVQKEFVDAGNKATEDWCKKTMEESQNRYCPVASGTLKGSGSVKEESSNSEGVSYKMSYDAEYAAIVHETPASHRNGQWKFLSTPVNLRSQKLIEDLKYGIGGVL